MLVNDILLATRKNLADQKEEKWSNGELIDNINSAIIEICRDTLIFKSTIYIDLFDNKESYNLPKDFLSIIHASVADEDCIIKSYDYLQKNYLNISDYTIALDGINLHLYPRVTDKMRFSYNYFIQIDEIEDEVQLPLFVKNALVFYVMHLAHMSPVKSENMKLSVDYLKLYKTEIQTIKDTLLSNKNSRNTKTKHQRI